MGLISMQTPESNPIPLFAIFTPFRFLQINGGFGETALPSARQNRHYVSHTHMADCVAPIAIAGCAADGAYLDTVGRAGCQAVDRH